MAVLFSPCGMGMCYSEEKRMSEHQSGEAMWPRELVKTLYFETNWKYVVIYPFKNIHYWASLVAQWLRVCLPMQGTWVRALVWEDPTCHRATGPQLLELCLWATITEPVRLEPLLGNKRGRDSERPVHRDEEWPLLAATGESPHTEMKTQHSQK